jgi:hypothetical protein
VIDSGDLWVFEVAPRNESITAAEAVVEGSVLENVEAMTQGVTEGVTEEMVVVVGDQS